MMVGSETTRLIVLRGNSGSGKSRVAAEICARYGSGIALVGQDNLRRVVLHEHDIADGANIGLIDTVARYALDAGYHVVVEGILFVSHYGKMLRDLLADHQGSSHPYYLDVPFAETLRRHATRPQATEFGEREMRAWYHASDLLPDGVETILGADNSLEATVDRVLHDSGLIDLLRPQRVSSDLPGWTVHGDANTTVQWTTPTGHAYESRPPPLLGHGNTEPPRTVRHKRRRPLPTIELHPWPLNAEYHGLRHRTHRN